MQLALGRGAQATSSFERVLRLEDIEQSAPITAETRLALAQVLASRPEHRERARELARRALEFYTRHPWDAREKAVPLAAYCGTWTPSTRPPLGATVSSGTRPGVQVPARWLAASGHVREPCPPFEVNL